MGGEVGESISKDFRLQKWVRSRRLLAKRSLRILRGEIGRDSRAGMDDTGVLLENENAFLWIIRLIELIGC